MSRNRKLITAIRKNYKRFRKKFLYSINKQIIWLLRALFGSKKRRGAVNAGFVLPTVVMVGLVVILLTTAILFRSFDRAQNASNVRVNEAVLKAATPALDRAKAKISELFSDPTLPRAVPSNGTLYNTLINKLKNYTLGDETPLTVGYDLNGNNKIEAPANGILDNQEIIQTAWKFPVDTDNNGKFDSFILYGLFFRNPPLASDGISPSRARSPLDARTPPMLPAKAGSVCDAAANTSASLVGDSGWYKLPTGELKKSFFVYAVTVPITDTSSLDSSIQSKYETYKGNQSFSAIELQEDRAQLPLTNNAVVYEDDLDITPGPQFQLNGRIFTNSNLLTGQSYQSITLYQVSSPNSCYYQRENGSILVGGNVALNNAISDGDAGGNTSIHLFKENTTPDTSQTLSDKSTSNQPNQVAYNSQAYAQRIDLLVNAQLSNASTTDPSEVQNNILSQLSSNPSLDPTTVRQQQLQVYFRERTRRVPFIEVPYGTAGTIKSQSDTSQYTTANVLQGSGDSLRPQDTWVIADGNTGLTLNYNKLTTNDPNKLQQTTPLIEKNVGDRISVGNNLPELMWGSNNFVGSDQPQQITGQTWNDDSVTRTRTTQVQQLADLGITQRDGFWEVSAASPRANVLDVLGGLRVITGAGVYRSAGSNLISPPTAAPDDPSTSNINESTIGSQYIVWSDAMPMLVPKPTAPTDPSQQSRGHLVMRATAVYHYNNNAYDPQNTTTPVYYQKPIACVSSYYNPTNATTATTDGYTPNDPTNANKSNNGFVYGVSSTTAQNITRGNAFTNGLFTPAAGAENVTNSGVNLLDRLMYQANLIFPNGHFVNPLLRQALNKATNLNLTLSEQSAIDSTICAIQIADGTLSRNNSVIPNQAIYETTFLDARQIKAIDADPNNTTLNVPAPQSSLTGKYDLAIEQRQPLEIRATVIDLNLLRQTSITGTWSSEYLLPNSGIIYATRDDAQADESQSNSATVSATDYKLDPERRPNAIMLINGSDLSRQNNYRPEEKGLILATNLPVYIQGNFNLHTYQEFKDYTINSSSDYNNFYSRQVRDPNFACRPNDPRLPNCTTGEHWRPASVIADAVTLLSTNFRLGYRNEGDYDLRNNQENANSAITNRLKNGFWDNNFVTSSNFYLPYNSTTQTYSSYDNYYSGSPNPTSDPVTRNSSYFNNYVTPIQQRAQFPEYVMEMCFKLQVSECGPTDWYVGYDGDSNNVITDAESKVQSSALPTNAAVGQLVAGTTAQSPKSGFERYVRRVAFQRNSSGQLFDANGVPNSLTGFKPIVLGIKSLKVSTFKVDTTSVTLPDQNSNTLWFTTTKDGTTKYYNNNQPLFYTFPTGADATYQPLLEPILQLQIVKTGGPADTSNYTDLPYSYNDPNNRLKNTRWLSKATATTFNLAMAAGDTPSRVGNTTYPYYETNGGLHNFVRLLENWDQVNTNISGSFIQFQRSSYATAPYQVFARPTSSGTPTVSSLFPERNNIAYMTDSTTKGEAPFYMAPNRNWGFDVGLLPQNPDLFAQRFVVPPSDAPNEYYREISRDDRWVKTLMCAVEDPTLKDGFDSGFIITIQQTNNSVTQQNTKYALPSAQRPQTCPLGIPN